MNEHSARASCPRRAWFAAVGALGAASLIGCAGDTGSERFAFEAYAGGALGAAAPLTFTNARGWTVTLQRADVVLGPLYLNVLPPLRATRGPFDWLLPLAHAQSDHLAEGRIAGEVLGQVRFSALSAELTAFDVMGTATEEPTRTAEVWFYPEPGLSPESAAIEAAALSVEGVAVRDGVSIAFGGALTLNDQWLTEQAPGARGSTTVTALRQVRGIAAELNPRAGGRLELRLDAAALFRGADFASLAARPIEADGSVRLSQEPGQRDQVMNNLYQGLQAASGTYALSWVDP